MRLMYQNRLNIPSSLTAPASSTMSMADSGRSLSKILPGRPLPGPWPLPPPLPRVRGPRRPLFVGGIVWIGSSCPRHGTINVKISQNMLCTIYCTLEISNLFIHSMPYNTPSTSSFVFASPEGPYEAASRPLNSLHPHLWHQLPSSCHYPERYVVMDWFAVPNSRNPCRPPKKPF